MQQHRDAQGLPGEKERSRQASRVDGDHPNDNDPVDVVAGQAAGMNGPKEIRMGIRFAGRRRIGRYVLCGSDHVNSLTGFNLFRLVALMPAC